jgi:hypothetical protein
MRTPRDRKNPIPDRPCIGMPAKDPSAAWIRAPFHGESSMDLWGWPSRGSLIVLRPASALDFAFLGLSPTDPASYTSRDRDQASDDDFCRRLLLLGAKWSDSYERYKFVCRVADNEEVETQALEDGEQPSPSKMERRWLSIAWTTGSMPKEEVGIDGFWLAEYETSMWGWEARGNFVPPETAREALAMNMNQKCEILKGLGAKFYRKPEDYDGVACIIAWTSKESGEFGPLRYEPSPGL